MKMDSALNNLQRLKCHKTQTNKQTNKQIRGTELESLESLFHSNKRIYFLFSNDGLISVTFSQSQPEHYQDKVRYATIKYFFSSEQK